MSAIREVAPPFALASSYSSLPDQHSLVPASSAGAAQQVLPLGQEALLNVRLQASAALVLRSLQLLPAPGWEAQPLRSLGGDVSLEEGDVFTERIALTPTRAAPSLSPGALVLTWAPSAEHNELDGAVSTQLLLSPVGVAEASLSITGRWPDSAVLGQRCQLVLELRNDGPLLQEVHLSVVDSPAFVFAGERSADLTLLPRSTSKLVLFFVAYAAGWQAWPEVTLLAKRVCARLALSAGKRVCVHQALTV
jgi:hypothetical protein